MFSGIVQEIGSVVNFSRYQKRSGLQIRCAKIAQHVTIGDSVSVNGVCLTLTKKESSIMSFDVLAQTSNLTTLGLLKNNENVNLETALKPHEGISGHFVTGHIDCVGDIRKKEMRNNNYCYEISVPPRFMRLLAPKGSVAVDGISLTVVDVFKDTFSVYIIAHTLENTILYSKGRGTKVNIEFDILSKYVARRIGT